MKICPFISHMIGDDSVNTLTLERDTSSASSNDSSDNVVVLGYDEGQTAVGTKTKRKTTRKTKTTTKSDAAAGLQCLEEACRFYHKTNADCQFDLIFDMLDKQKNAPKPKTAVETKELKKDLDKIWKFQTKSIAELLESFADSEKKQSDVVSGLREEVEKLVDTQSDTVSGFRNEVGERFDALSKDIGQGSVPTGLELKFEELSKRIADREDSVEDLSVTMSEMVVNLQDGIDRLREKSEGMMEQVDKIQRDFPSTDQIKSAVEESVAVHVKAIDIPDFDKAFRGIERKVEKALQNDSSAGVEAKLEETLSVHRDIEEKMNEWHRKLESNMSEIKEQQNNWEKRLSEITDKQQDFVEFVDEGRQRHDDDQSRRSKKEAKKYNNLGVTSFHNGAYEMAKEQFLKAVSMDLEFAEGFNNLGLAYTELNEEDNATEAFERAVDINPSLHAAYNNLGYIFFKRGNYEQAVEMYNEALGRSTNNSSAYTNLGNAYYKMDKIDEARTAWEKALELDPANEKAQRNLERIGDSK